MIGIIGKKLGMTQIFAEDGEQIPCTVVEAPPNPVVKVTTKDKAGFASVELGYGSQRVARESAKGEKKTPRGHRAHKAEIGHAAKVGLQVTPAVLRSIRLDDKSNPKAEIKTYNVGDTVTVGEFKPGDVVKVTGTSKGRGFQGIVKRHYAGGGPNTHGNTKHRRPGAVGAGTDPSRVIKGKRMPGHYGAERHTQINLRVVKVDGERNLLYIRGAVAGPTNGIVVVRKQA
ncbi:MAG TPA: 50S ribosomal protein L3 [Gemmatimonadaceae bacterium]|nr:50S ribosomal protein L3 [Gemmatimonadaceae bacterium]